MSKKFDKELENLSNSPFLTLNVSLSNNHMHMFIFIM